jgi:hypothetical protein
MAITPQRVADMHFEVVKTPDLPNLACLNCCFFPKLKKHLQARKFLSIEEATVAVDGWLAAHWKFSVERLRKLEQRSDRCVELKGEYIITFLMPIACCFLYKACELSAHLPYHLIKSFGPLFSISPSLVWLLVAV